MTVTDKIRSDALILRAFRTLAFTQHHIDEACCLPLSPIQVRDDLTAARKDLDTVIDDLKLIRDVIDENLNKPAGANPPKIFGLSWQQERTARPFDPAPSPVTDNDGRVALYSISSDEEPDVVTTNQAAS